MYESKRLPIQSLEVFVVAIHFHIFDFHHGDLGAIQQYHLLLQRVRRVLLAIESESIEAVVVLDGYHEHDGALVCGLFVGEVVGDMGVEAGVVFAPGEVEGYPEAFKSYSVALESKLLGYGLSLHAHRLSGHLIAPFIDPFFLQGAASEEEEGAAERPMRIKLSVLIINPTWNFIEPIFSSIIQHKMNSSRKWTQFHKLLEVHLVTCLIELRVEGWLDGKEPEDETDGLTLWIGILLILTIILQICK